MNPKFFVTSLAAMVMLSASIGIAASGVSLEGVKCLMVAKNDAKKEKASKWKDGKVYFCCDNCLAKYEKMSKEEKEKHAASANHQLVATKQYAQQACPFSGKPVADDTQIKVSGAEIGFCCTNCKGTAEKMKDDEKVEKLFGEKAFKMAKFEVVKEKAE
ncbi:MAG: hypothetical protein KDB22_00360 [Planctomycetales bacterium]|nr:hypothetical protein [Planctomycetales bacterium]